MMKKYLSLIFLFGCFSIAFGQTTIYSEDFTGQGSKGAVGPIPIVNLTEVNWDIDISGANLNSETRYIQVHNDFLEGRALSNSAIWLSPVIDITGFTNVQFSLDAFSNATQNLENSDTFVTEYRINGGAWVIAANNGTLINDFPLTVVSDIGLSGNTIELMVTMTNNGGNERHRLDNILVEGTAPTATPVVTVNPNTVSGFGYVENENSLQEGTFTVQGFNLLGDIDLTAPANFEISTTSGSGFGNTITLTQTTGMVNLTTIFVRLISGLTANSYNDTLTTSSTGAVARNVSLTGEVTAPIADCSQLLISEYHEANPGGDEKYIEIYNPSGSSIDLSNYRLANYRNDDGIAVSIDLSGTILPNSTFTIARSVSSFASEADLATNSNVMTFSGNDAIALQTILGENIDIIGYISANFNYAQNIILRRNIDIAIPTINYDPSQWSTATPNDTDNLGTHVSNCECPDTTTWTTSGWDNGTPISSSVAIIVDDYNTSVGGNQSSFIACSLIVNSTATLTIADNNFIQIQNDIIANGNINVASKGSVVQIDDLGTVSGSGIIEVTKMTAPMNNWYEYTYWSSPTANTSIDNGLTDGNVNRRFLFNAQNYLDEFMESNNDNTQVPGQDDVDDDANAWTLASGIDIMTPGVGYASTHRADLFFGPPMSSPPYQFDYSFIGPFNNGIYNVPVYKNNATTSDTNWNFIGNPYPSAISVDDFFNENVNLINPSGLLDGVVYLWSQNTQPSSTDNGNQTLNFVQSDYAMINGTGETQGGDDTNGDGMVDINDRPNRFIPSGQGFFVSFSDIPAPTTGNVIFNNAMRVTGDNDQFFRNSSSSNNNANKIWLNLTTDNGVFNQILVGYIDGATNDFDGSYYDVARTVAGGYNSVIYSKIENNDRSYAIQGKNPNTLNEDESIAVGFNTLIDEPTIYTISMPLVEGDFLNNNDIYLRDNLLNILHSLKESDYNFSSEVGEFGNRFDIVFRADALSIDDNRIAPNQLTILELADGTIEVNVNGSLTISTIEILDITGRQIYSLKGNASTEVYNLSKLSKAAYIARVTLSNGQVISKKAIKQH